MSDYTNFKLYLNKELMGKIDAYIKKHKKIKSRSAFVNGAIERELKIKLGFSIYKK